MSTESLIEILYSDVEIQIGIIKTVFLALCTYWSILKLINDKNRKSEFWKYIIVAIIAFICGIIRYQINLWISTICLIFLISMIYSIKNLTKSILVTIISLSINYAIMAIAITVDFLFTINGVSNDYINLVIIMFAHILLIVGFFKIKRFKYGFSFLQKEDESEIIDSIMLDISISMLLVMIIFSYSYDNTMINVILTCFIIFFILMITNIKKSIKVYYKQKLLKKELSETKEELENEKLKKSDLENDNINFKKKIHSIEHKQKSLENKLNKISTNMEIAAEIDIRDRLNQISKELHERKANVELTKIGISNIDDMLDYMQSECEKNNIEFNLKTIGNIFYMTNNLVSKDDLEILLADHIKNAIIAINHASNINKSILIKLGKVSTNYGLYIYDSGIQFKKDVIENLGKKPITTYEKEGGTGIGFMNTFNILEKYNASLYIKEIGEPSKDNFTKIIMIEFNNKNEFKIIK